jgi:hypothetical protein
MFPSLPKQNLFLLSSVGTMEKLLVTSNSYKVKSDGLDLLLGYLEATLEEVPEVVVLYSNAINVAAFNEGTENLDLEYTPITSTSLIS